MSPTDSPHSSPLPVVSRELLVMLADAGAPLSVNEVVGHGGLDARQATLQLSVAKVAGFVRAVPGSSGGVPLYAPTPLGFALARRSRAFAVAQVERDQPA